MGTMPSSIIRPAMPSSSPSKNTSKRKGRESNDRENKEQSYVEKSTDSNEVSHDEVDVDVDVDTLQDEQKLEQRAKLDLIASEETESEDDEDFRRKRRPTQASLLVQRKVDATKQQTDGPGQSVFDFGEPDTVEAPPRMPLTSVRQLGAEPPPEHQESGVFDFDDEGECVVIAPRKNTSSSIALPKPFAMPPSLPRKPPPLDSESRLASKRSRVRALPTLSNKRKSAESKKPTPAVVSVGGAQQATGSSSSQRAAALSITESGHDSPRKLGVPPSPKNKSPRKVQTTSLAKIREELNVSCPLDLLSEIASKVEEQTPTALQEGGVGKSPTYVFEDLPNSLALLADTSLLLSKEKAPQTSSTKTGVLTPDRAKSLPVMTLLKKSADPKKSMKSTAAAVLHEAKKARVVTKHSPNTAPVFILPKIDEMKTISTPETVLVLPWNETANPSPQMAVMTGDAPKGAAPTTVENPNPTVGQPQQLNGPDRIAVTVLEGMPTTSVTTKHVTALAGVQGAAKTTPAPLVAATLNWTQPVDKTSEVATPQRMEPAVQEALSVAHKSSISGTQLEQAPVETKVKANMAAQFKPFAAAPEAQPAQQMATTKPNAFFAHKLPVTATGMQPNCANLLGLTPTQIAPILQTTMPPVVLTAPLDMAPITGTLHVATNQTVPLGVDAGVKMALLDAGKPTYQLQLGQAGQPLTVPAPKKVPIKRCRNVKTSKATGRSSIVNKALKDFVMKGRTKDLVSTTLILPYTTTVKVPPQLAEGGRSTQMIHGVMPRHQNIKLSSGAKEAHQIVSQPTTQRIGNPAHDPVSLVGTRPLTTGPNLSPKRSTSYVLVQENKKVTSQQQNGTPAVLTKVQVNGTCSPTGIAAAVTPPAMVTAQMPKSQKTLMVVPQEVLAMGASHTCGRGQSGLAVYGEIPSNVTLGPTAIAAGFIMPTAQMPETKKNSMTAPPRQVHETQSQGKSGNDKSPTQSPNQKRPSTETTQVNFVATTGGQKQQPNRVIQPLNEDGVAKEARNDSKYGVRGQNGKFVKNLSLENGKEKRKQKNAASDPRALELELSGEKKKVSQGIRMPHPGLHTVPAVVQISNSEAVDIENEGSGLDDSSSKPVAAQDRIDAIVGKDYGKRFGRSQLYSSSPVTKKRVKLHHTEQFAPDSKVEFVDVVTSIVEGEGNMGIVSVHRYLNPNPPTQVSSKEDGFVFTVLEKRSKGRWAGCHVTDVVELDALLSQCVVEMPPAAMPGDEFLVTWPAEPQRVHIFAPGCKLRSILNARPSRRSQRQMSDRYTHGAISTENQVGWWKSPGKEWKHYTKSSSRVGPNHQVSRFPSSSAWQESSENEEDMFPPGYGVLWECDRADEEDDAQEGDVYDFVDRVNSCNRFKMMEILHNNNYSAAEASSVRCDDLEVTRFTKMESEAFERLIIDDNGKPDKSFSRIAKALGKSVSAVLIHYYGAFKMTETYENMKRRQVEDSEWCIVCNDGGDLIMCDRCVRWYHTKCIGLTKKEIPAGEWFCNDCKEEVRKQGVETVNPGLQFTTPRKLGAEEKL